MIHAITNRNLYIYNLDNEFDGLEIDFLDVTINEIDFRNKYLVTTGALLTSLKKIKFAFPVVRVIKKEEYLTGNNNIE